MLIPEQGFRRVIHADLDCFFAAVEELDDPSLRGRPVIVGGDPDRRGVVSTANYIARRYGVHSAQSAALARRLCPRAIFLRPRFERYRALSRQVMDILSAYVTVLEQVSIDEAYGELPPGLPGSRPAQFIGAEIKARVYDEVGLVISIGAAQNKVIAKLASDMSKPDGLLVVKPGEELAFLRPLPVGRLNGVGPHTRERLEALGLATIGDLAARPLEELRQRFGKTGAWLWRLANGQDDRPVVADHGLPKSISTEDTFDRDIADLDRAAGQVARLARLTAKRAAEQRVTGRGVTLKVRWSDFRIMTRQGPLPFATDDGDIIAATALELLEVEIGPLLAAGGAIRLLGVGLHNISAADGDDEFQGREIAPGFYQPPLFDRTSWGATSAKSATPQSKR
jgi:DNA polymerase-4